MGMNLVVDSGNSFTKTAFFEKNCLSGTLHKVKNEDIYEALSNIDVQNIIISTVSSVDFSFLKARHKVISLDHTTPIPIINMYLTPETLGADRLAAVTGAAQIFPGNDCLVIDAGTCITYDLIDKEKRYLGGSISPGINLRYRTLNAFTARLPLLEGKETGPLTGRNTIEAIKSGVLHGILCEVGSMINLYREQYTDLKVIICGGDLGFFETNLKETIFAIPELVLIGLNSILEHNVQEA